ncbi:hypothetical protein WDU94_012335, partial [Cyamophila willieti]
EHNKQKPLHGQFFRTLDEEHVDKDTSLGWLKNSHLKGETESLLIAAQDQALNTRYHQKKILKQAVDGKCRLCRNADEHISHILSGCTQLASTEYLARHNKVAAYIHWTICKQLGSLVPDKYYEHVPKTVTNIQTQDQDITILWDMSIITDRQINANRPDIVIHDKKKKICLLVDVAVPDDKNVAIKETEKRMKYKDLELEISRMWNTRARIVPVVMGALGTIKKGFEEHLKQLPGRPKAWEIQKIVLLGSAHILRKVLS